MHYGVKISSNGEGSNELDLTFRVPNGDAKTHQNRVKIATVEEVTYPQRETDACDFITCSIKLCYISGTDNIL